MVDTAIFTLHATANNSASDPAQNKIQFMTRRSTVAAAAASAAAAGTSVTSATADNPRAPSRRNGTSSRKPPARRIATRQGPTTTAFSGDEDDPEEDHEEQQRVFEVYYELEQEDCYQDEEETSADADSSTAAAVFAEAPVDASPGGDDGMQGLSADLDFLENFVAASDLHLVEAEDNHRAVDNHGNNEDDDDEEVDEKDSTERSKLTSFDLLLDHHQHHPALHHSSSPLLHGGTDGNASMEDPTMHELENSFCRDFHCCGLTLRDMHELLHHYEECHVQFEDSEESQPPEQHDPSVLWQDDASSVQSLLGEISPACTALDTPLLSAAAMSPQSLPLEAIIDEFEYHLNADPNKEGHLVVRQECADANNDCFFDGKSLEQVNALLGSAANAASSYSGMATISPNLLSSVSAPCTPLLGSNSLVGEHFTTPISAFDDSIIRSSRNRHDDHLLMSSTAAISTRAADHQHLIRRIGDVEDDLNLRLLQMMEEELQDGKRVKMLAEIESEKNALDSAEHAASSKKRGNKDGSLSKKKRSKKEHKDEKGGENASVHVPDAAEVEDGCCKEDADGGEEQKSDPKLEMPKRELSETMLSTINVPILSLNEALGLELPAHLAGEDIDRADKPYRCTHPGCDKAYKNPNGLKYHNIHGHCEGDEDDADFAARLLKPYVCNFTSCFKRYKNLNGLKYHMEKSHGFSKADANQLATTIVKRTNAEYGINARSVASNVLLAAMREKESRDHGVPKRKTVEVDISNLSVGSGKMNATPKTPSMMDLSKPTSLSIDTNYSVLLGGAFQQSQQQPGMPLSLKPQIPLAPKANHAGSSSGGMTSTTGKPPMNPFANVLGLTTTAPGGSNNPQQAVTLNAQALKNLLLSQAAAFSRTAQQNAAATNGGAGASGAPANPAAATAAFSQAYLQVLAASGLLDLTRLQQAQQQVAQQQQQQSQQGKLPMAGPAQPNPSAVPVQPRMSAPSMPPAQQPPVIAAATAATTSVSTAPPMVSSAPQPSK